MEKKESFFWTSYSDLMTSMFFVMLVLFVLVVALLHKKMTDIDAERKATQAQLEVIKEIETSTQNIDSTYFEYRPEHKKHVLKIKVLFPRGSSSMDDIDYDTRSRLIDAGKSVRTFIEDITEKHPEIQYLMVIEGQASKDLYRRNYELSHERALSLMRLWDIEGISFGENCEVVIGGNGDGSLYGTGFMRESYEPDNQRFLIHILPKTSIPEKK